MAATGMNLNFQLSPQQTCRVALQPSEQTVNKGTMLLGEQTYVTPSGVRYMRPGMTVSDFNQRLRLPQRRTFLGPEYFNGGCVTPYCKDSTQCPESTQATVSPRTNSLFAAAFDTPFDFTGNDAPPQCFQGVCSGYNSVVGWETAPTGELRWQSKTAAERSQSCSQ